MKEGEARAKLEAALPQWGGAQALWRQKTALPGGEGVFWLFKHEDQVAGVCEAQPVRAFDVPDWGRVRKGRREREIAVLRMYLGAALWEKRVPAPPSERMREEEARAVKAAMGHSQALSVEVVELCRVPGYGAAVVTMRRAMSYGALQLVNQQGRAHSPNPKVLAMIAEHATWYFLGLEFFDKEKAKQRRAKSKAAQGRQRRGATPGEDDPP